MTAHKWQFAAHFRYHAFGWQSDKPIQHIKEALSEIKRVAKKEPELAAAGAVLFLEKISPAIEQPPPSPRADSPHRKQTARVYRRQPAKKIADGCVARIYQNLVGAPESCGETQRIGQGKRI
ncbi:MAG: hypothetical protein ACXWTY_01160 [Methylobacter sp.]